MARRKPQGGTTGEIPSELELHPQLEGDLFETVQTEECFEDCKHFVDHVLRADPETVQRRFRDRREDDDFDVREFVAEHFEAPTAPLEEAAPKAGSMVEHVSQLWEHLVEPQEAEGEYDSLIPLPNPHVVPGGRFRESYYWDTYFVAEGLAAEGRVDLVEDLVENLASLIDRFGFVPNGNRRYLLSRSQPPVFSELVAVLVRERGVEAAEPHLPRLEREYEFWMRGSEALDGDDDARQRVVGLDGDVLNRYWDDAAAPRPESYREDVTLAQGLDRDRGEVFRHVRAACESGWDFSGRWCDDPEDFGTIRTTEFVPVDLNAFLYSLERRLADWFGALEDGRAEEYAIAARRRRAAIDRHCWDPDAGFYFDRDLRGGLSDVWSLAAVAPLYAGCASDRQAEAVAEQLREEFLEIGGLLTTLCETGQQWDAPNGWAPLQWMAVRGLRRYGHDELAEEIEERWLALNRDVYESEGVLLEKYDVTPGGHAGGGGEYPLQTGFGWTNGVAAALEDGDLGGEFP